MLNKKIFFTFGVLLVFGLLVVGAVYNLNVEGGNNLENKIYQGPVPEGYDLEHYRNTGETIKIKEGVDGTI